VSACQEKVHKLFPKFETVVVQLKTKETQPNRVKPTYALVACPVEDLGAEPISLTIRAQRGTPADGCSARCTELDCPYRPPSAKDELQKKLEQSQAVNPLEEISSEDRVDLLAMLEAEVEEEEESEEEEKDEEENDDSCAKADADPAKKRDCIVDLWPWAKAPRFYEQIFQGVAGGDKASVDVDILCVCAPGSVVGCPADELGHPRVREAAELPRAGPWLCVWGSV